MHDDGSRFLRRASRIIQEARRGRPVSPRWLAELEEISIATAQRTFERLRDEYDAPLVYRADEHAWFLERPFELPLEALSSRAELIAFALSLQSPGAAADPQIAEALQLLRGRIAARLGAQQDRLQALLAGFVAERSDEAILREPCVLPLLEAIADSRRVRFTYCSPWTGDSRQHELRPVLLRQLDGAIHLLAATSKGYAPFNTAGISALELGEPAPRCPDDAEAIASWRRSFGVWFGPEVDITVRIAQPAAAYYARVCWHESQTDQWDGEHLVRSFRGHDSPEMARRLLSVGTALHSVEPPSLHHKVSELLHAMATRFGPA